MDYKDWINQIKADRPELAEFVTKLEVLISDTGFNTSKFESAIESGLKKIEIEQNKSFNKDDNA